MGEIFGRERELALADTSPELAGGRSGALLIEGEAGIGKTTVWHEVMRRAKERGVGVLSCQPAETETKLALSAVCDLLETVPEGVFATLPAPQRRALDVALLRAEPGGAAQPPALATAVRSVLAALSAERPLLVAVDDVQWLDATSATVLGFSLRRLAGTRVGWLLARRLPHPGRLAVDRLVPAGSLTRVALGPLTVAAIYHMLKDRLEQPLSRSVLVRVHKAAGGNPFYALEIARELARTRPAAGAPLPVPDDLRKLISARVRRLPEATRDALLAAAALSDPAISLVDEHALAAAEEAELVRIDRDGSIAFGHPLYASAVYGSASRARRRQMHARLAAVVGDREERARHLALAAAGPDEKVARALEDGAALARSRGGWESAAELLEQAAHLTPPEQIDGAHQRWVTAAENHVRAGDRPRARRLLEAVLAEPLQRPMRADALRLLAEVSQNDLNFSDAAHLFAEALEYTGDSHAAGRIELGLAWVCVNLADYRSSRAHADRALELAEAAGEEPLAAEALAVCAMTNFLCGNGVDWGKVHRSLALEDPNSAGPLQRRPSTIAALLLAYVGRHSEARTRLAAVCATARERGDESDLAFVLLQFSKLETQSGNLAAAAELVEEAQSLASLTGSLTMHAWALAQRAYVHAHRGEVSQTRRACDEATPLLARFGQPVPRTYIAAALGLLELSLGNPQAAWHACEPLTEAFEQHGIAELLPTLPLPEALEALISTGQLDRAEALLDAFEARARKLDRPWALATGRRCHGLLLAARNDIPGAVEALDQALVEHERLDMPLEHARTLLVKGMVQRRARKRARARESLEQALAIFATTGARIWAERARTELGRLGLRRAAAGQLTHSERRTAELAAQGLTNREVAAALFMSPKTVEANLASVYHKLKIASRAELGARMAAPQTQGHPT